MTANSLHPFEFNLSLRVYLQSSLWRSNNRWRAFTCSDYIYRLLYSTINCLTAVTLRNIFLNSNFTNMLLIFYNHNLFLNFTHLKGAILRLNLFSDTWLDWSTIITCKPLPIAYLKQRTCELNNIFTFKNKSDAIL